MVDKENAKFITSYTSRAKKRKKEKKYTLLREIV
jgi:hypothetical protein